MNHEPPGTVLAGRYHLIAPIGHGGMGTVYKALDLTFNRLVAVKTLHSPSAHATELLFREARAAARLQHPGILNVLDFGEQGGSPYIVMEFIEGRSLAEIIREGKPLATDYAIAIVTEVGAALALAHRHGVIHRDVKPGNILIGASGRVVISDFGLAVRPGDDTLTAAGTVLGTPAYMSPEQAIGRPLDGRSDIYSLAIVLYEALIGRSWLAGRSTASEILPRVVEASVQPIRELNPSVPVSVDRVLRRALSKSREQRYQTIDDFVADLRSATSKGDLRQGVGRPPGSSAAREGPGLPSTPAPKFTPAESAPLRPAPASAARPTAGILVLAILVTLSGVVVLGARPTFGATLSVGAIVVLLVAVTLWVRVWKARSLADRSIGSRAVTPDTAEVSTDETAEVSGYPGSSPLDDTTSVSVYTRPLDSPTTEAPVYRPSGIPATLTLRDSSAGNWLLVLNGPHRGRQLPLSLKTTIGRSSDNDVVLSDDSATSRRHAEITFKDDRFHIRDLSSTGTLVNSVKVQHQELRDRDEIHIGSTTLLFISATVTDDGRADARRRQEVFASVWEGLTRAATMVDKERFVAAAVTLAHGLLREAIGYRIEQQIPYFKDTVGFMVEVPLLWIRHSRFPILFVAYARERHDALATVVNQLEIAKSTEFFALLIVVPAREGASGIEADELRQVVADSVYRHDFVVLNRDHVASIIAHNSSKRLVDIILEQGIELSTLSPYVVRGPVPSSMFFGRESEIKKISQTIFRSDHAVVGGRRIGKSSILLRLKRLFGDDRRYLPIYLDCEARFDYEDFFAGVGEHLNMTVTADPLAFQRTAATLRGASLPVFLFDEVDELLSFDAKHQPPGQLFKAFRAASQEGVCRFVFSGSRTLYRQLHDPQSPFFNFCDATVLRRLHEKSIAEIVRKPMQQLSIDLPEEEQLILRLIELTSCHPNIAQWVCDELIKSSIGRRITLQALENLATTPEFYEYYLSTAWSDATTLEKFISLIVETPVFSESDVRRKLDECGLPQDRRVIQNALDVLELYSMLECTESRYTFALAEFPRIVRRSGVAAAQLEYLTAEIQSQCS
jgi:hypothetical protein